MDKRREQELDILFRRDANEIVQLLEMDRMRGVTILVDMLRSDRDIPDAIRHLLAEMLGDKFRGLKTAERNGMEPYRHSVPRSASRIEVRKSRYSAENNTHSNPKGFNSMRMMEAMIGCNTGGEIEVGPWPDKTGWSDRYDWTFGACYLDRHKFAPALQVAVLFIDFQQAVVDYEVPVADVHREFLKIDEYRWHIAPDCDGAEEMPEEWARLLHKGQGKRR